MARAITALSYIFLLAGCRPFFTSFSGFYELPKIENSCPFLQLLA